MWLGYHPDFRVRAHRLAVTTLALAVLPSTTTAQGSASAAITAFVGVNVIPMDRERVLERQTVLVREGKIAVLGAVDKVTVPAGAVRIDGRGKFLIPGLADMHMHLGSGDPSGAERQLFLLLANGVTVVRNMDYSYSPEYGLDKARILGLRSRAAAGELWSPRIYTSGVWHTRPDESIDSNIVEYKAAGYDHIKIHDQAVLGGIQDSTMFDSVVTAARRLGLPIVGHVVQGLQQALDLPYTSIEHLSGYPHDTLELPALAAATKRAGIWNCPTVRDMGTTPTPLERRYGAAEKKLYLSQPHDFVAGVFWERSRDENEVARLERYRRKIAALREAGAGLLLGTDSPTSVAPAGFSVHRELEALVGVGLTPYQALETGTRNVAEYLGRSNESGTVAAGKRADLVLLTANPLVDIRNTGQLAGVMIGGRWLALADIERRLADYYH